MTKDAEYSPINESKACCQRMTVKHSVMKATEDGGECLFENEPLFGRKYRIRVWLLLKPTESNKVNEKTPVNC